LNLFKDFKINEYISIAHIFLNNAWLSYKQQYQPFYS